MNLRLVVKLLNNEKKTISFFHRSCRFIVIRCTTMDSVLYGTQRKCSFYAIEMASYISLRSKSRTLGYRLSKVLRGVLSLSRPPEDRRVRAANEERTKAKRFETTALHAAAVFAFRGGRERRGGALRIRAVRAAKVRAGATATAGGRGVPPSRRRERVGRSA